MINGIWALYFDKKNIYNVLEFRYLATLHCLRPYESLVDTTFGVSIYR
jgi:hypothetical protein